MNFEYPKQEGECASISTSFDDIKLQMFTCFTGFSMSKR